MTLDRLRTAAPPRRYRRAVEFLRFSAVGCSGIGVNLGTYYGLTRWLAMPIATASPLAIELSVLWNFVLNDRWTFGGRRTERRLAARVGRFHAVSVAAGGINYLILLLLAMAGWWDIAANLIGIAAGAVVKFGVNSSWTWREQRSASQMAAVALRQGRAQ